MLNHVIIAGRMARDPELRRTQSGTPVVSFTLAVDRDFKDKTTGDRITDWIDCVAWKSTAEYVSRYGSKGRTAAVSGRLQIRDWTDKDGNKRRTAEVMADQVYFMDSKRETLDKALDEYISHVCADKPQEQNFEALDDDQTELPF